MLSEVPPFFSVCLPVTNRGTTIFAALTSVGRQIYRNFELVIVDCGSTDDSRAEIERYFASNEYRENRFLYTYQCRDYIPQTVEDWNEPVLQASGRYIAMLEGDDQFLPQYLQAAYEILSSDPTIGIYATGNQLRPRTRQGFFPPSEATRFIYGQTEVPPPSETIFIRTNHRGEPFLYNTQEYEYAPEVDLYIRITLDEYCVFFASTQHTVRDITPKNRTTWHYHHDRFVVARKYAPHLDWALSKELMERSLQLAVTASLVSRSFGTFRHIALQLMRIVGPVCYLGALRKAIVNYIGTKIMSRRN